MKVLHISTAKNWRGGERQTYYLIQGQKELGHEVHLMSPKSSVLSERSIDHCHNQLGFVKGLMGLMINCRRLSKYCAINNIDIINGHDSHAHTLIWLAYKYAGLKAKSVVTRRLANPIKKKSIGKYNYPNIESIICISQSVYQSLLPNIMDDSRLKIINSGVELPKNKVAGRRLKKKMTIGYVAAFTEEKDHITFVKAAKMLLESNEHLKFLLVGDGKLKSKIESLTSDCDSHFEFTGFVEDVNSLYSQVDILMHTSGEEALGTSIIDALKYGIPVVASNVGGINEILEDKKNGLLAEANNPDSFYILVSKILDEKGLYEALSDHAYSSIAKFDKAIMIGKTNELYINLLNP